VNVAEIKARKVIVRAEGAPAPIGPYSQATRLGDLVFVAGQGPIDPATKAMAPDIQSQTRQTLRNVQAILEAAGSGLEHVLKTTCYLRDMNEFGQFNQVYAEFFPAEPPARTTIQAARLPMDISVEIEVIAYVPSGR
jgi:2-iminobutanoate/2-iminopropanoate deaminase